jgi:TRAP-type C4-dicarboxylate transport system permease small subunit
MRRFYAKFDKGVELVEEAVMVASLSVIVILVVLQIFFRYILNSGILWADEIVTNLMVCMVMFGAPAATRRLLHTDIQVFVNKMPALLRNAVKIVTVLLGLMFLGLFIYSAAKFTSDSKGLATTVLAIPMPYIYVMMPIGAVLLLYEYIKIIPVTFIKDDNHS